jgi:hypothetical protein
MSDSATILTQGPLATDAFDRCSISRANNERSEMAARELIAAILTAGMLPTLEVPQSRTQRRSGPLTRAEGEAIQHAVDHAFGLYRLVLSGLGADPLAFEAESGAQTQAAAATESNAVWREQPVNADAADRTLVSQVRN